MATSVFDRLRGLLRGQSGISATLAVGNNRWSNTAWDFTRLVATVYAENPTGFRCIETRVNNFSRPDWQVKSPSDDTVIEKSPLLYLLNNPWLGVSGTQMQRSIQRDLCIIGRNFHLKMQGADGMGLNGHTTGLRRLAPQRVTVVGNEDDELVGFFYTDRNGKRAPILPENMVYLHYPHPERSYDGMAPALSAGLSSQIDTQAIRFNLDLLSNDGALPGIVSVEDLTPDEFAGFKMQWEAGENPGKVRFLGGKSTYQAIGQSNEQMAYEALRNASQEDISRAFGVNSVMLNPTDATYANLEQGKAMFMQQTMVPDWSLVADELTQQLGQEFDQKVDFDLSEIEELGDSKDQILDRGIKLVSAQAWSPNRLLEALDEEPVPWGAEPLRPIAVPMKPAQPQPLGPQADTPAPEPAPQPKPEKEPVPPAKHVKFKADQQPPQTTLTIDRAHRSTYHKRISRQMQTFFKRQGRVVAARVGAKKSAKAAQQQWWDQQRWDDELSSDMGDTYTEAAASFGTDASNNLGTTFNIALAAGLIASHVGDSAQSINSTTQSDVQQLIDDNPDISNADLEAMIQGYFNGDPASYRADMIGLTESTSAAGAGYRYAIDQSDATGMQYWATESGDPCPDCEGNEEAGPIALDEDFPSGDSDAPVHPNCACEVGYLIGDGASADEGDTGE